MDEKVGKNPNHKCVCKDTHPGLGPHRDCKKRGYHLCGCGKRSTLEKPDEWITTASSILYDEAHRKDTGKPFHSLEQELSGAKQEAQEMLHRSSSDDIDKFIASHFLKILEGLVETPLEKCIKMLNQIPQNCANVKEHYHAHHHTRKGLVHLCFIDLGADEEECAKKCASLMIALDIKSMDLIHLGNNEPVYHSSHVEMDSTFELGVHLDPIRRN